MNIRQRNVFRDFATRRDRMERHDSDEKITQEAISGLAHGVIVVIAVLLLLSIGLHIFA